ncbi:hypothetical protein GCM10027360_48250 [Amycolatopsis echigonensis]
MIHNSAGQPPNTTLQRLTHTGIHHRGAQEKSQRVTKDDGRNTVGGAIPTAPNSAKAVAGQHEIHPGEPTANRHTRAAQKSEMTLGKRAAAEAPAV